MKVEHIHFFFFYSWSKQLPLKCAWVMSWGKIWVEWGRMTPNTPLHSAGMPCLLCLTMSSQMWCHDIRWQFTIIVSACYAHSSSKQPCPPSLWHLSIHHILWQSWIRALPFPAGSSSVSSMEPLSSVLTCLSRCGFRSQCKGLPSLDPRECVCLHSSCCTAALPPPCYAFL